jgi:hypothetical protein
MIGYVLTAAVSLFAGAMIGFVFGLWRASHVIMQARSDDGRRDVLEWMIQTATTESLTAMRMRITREEIRRVNETRQTSWSP